MMLYGDGGGLRRNDLVDGLLHCHSLVSWWAPEFKDDEVGHVAGPLGGSCEVI